MSKAKVIFGNDAGIYLSKQAGAYNNRCSLCTLTNRNVFFDQKSKFVTGRALQRIIFGSINIYNFHAQSGGASDIIWALSLCEAPFVLGGDMNITPDDLYSQHANGVHREVCTGTQTRPGIVAKIARSNIKTHYKGSSPDAEYDYFLYSSRVQCRNIHTYTRRGGDHTPVFGTFS